MAEKDPIKRRRFLQLSSTAVLGGMTSKLFGIQRPEGQSMLEEVVQKVGTLPRRKLGYSGREVSVLIGMGDMDSLLAEAGARCGMNYWHKTNRWMRGRVPEIILKNREAHYCQITVDRVGSDHYSGHFNEEEHYRYVKEALNETGLGYFDDM